MYMSIISNCFTVNLIELRTKHYEIYILSKRNYTKKKRFQTSLTIILCNFRMHLCKKTRLQYFFIFFQNLKVNPYEIESSLNALYNEVYTL